MTSTGKAIEVQAALTQCLGLEAPDIAWHTGGDRIAEIGAFLALVTATCAKFALDVKLLMQTEVFEPYLPHRGYDAAGQKSNTEVNGFAYGAAVIAIAKPHIIHRNQIPSGG